MSWTAGVTRTTGQLVTAAQWNSYLGASGSLDFVHDALDDCSSAAPTRAIDTIYQNSTKIRIVTVTIELSSSGDHATAEIGVSSPPITQVAISGYCTEHILYISMSFVVPPNYYYRVRTSAGSPVKQLWHEWDLL